MSCLSRFLGTLLRSALPGLLAVLVTFTTAPAATWTWDPVGIPGATWDTSGQWTTPGAPNFLDPAPGPNGEDLVFGNSTNTTVELVAADQEDAVRSLTFNAGAPAYTFQRSSYPAMDIDLWGAMVNNSSNVQTFSCGISLDGAITVSGTSGDTATNLAFAVGDHLWFGGGPTYNGPFDMHVLGVLNGGGSFTINNANIVVEGAWTPSSAGLAKYGTGTLVLNGDSSTTRVMNIYEGAVRVGNNTALGLTSTSRNTIIRGGLTANGHLELYNNITLGENVTITGRDGPVATAVSVLNVSGDNTIGTLNDTLWLVGSGGGQYNFGSTSGKLLFNSRFTPSSSTQYARYLTFRGAGDGEFAGWIGSNNTATGCVPVVHYGSGTLTLSSSDNWRLSHQLSIGGGTLQYGANFGNTEADQAAYPLFIPLDEFLNKPRFHVQNTATATSTIDFSAVSVTGSGQIGLAGGGLTLDRILSGTGKVIGNVSNVAGGSIEPGATVAWYSDGVTIEHFVPGTGTLEFTGNLSMDGGALQYNLSNVPSADVLVSVGGDFTINSGTVNVTPTAGLLGAGTYNLLHYGSLTGSVANLTLTGIPASGSRISYTLTAPGDSYLKLNVSPGSPLNLTWVGNGTNNNWDVIATADWSAGEKFYNGDSVTFTDPGSISPTVNVVGALAPNNVTVNSSRDYTFSGSGSITANTLTKNGTGKLTIANTGTSTFGPTINLNAGTLSFKQSADLVLSSALVGGGTLLKEGSNMLTLMGNSSFTGPITVSSGTLKAGTAAALGDDVAGTTILGGVLDANALTLTEPLTVGGAGGTIVTNSGLSFARLASTTLNADVVVGTQDPTAVIGGNAWILQLTSLQGNNHALTKIGNNEVDVYTDTGLGDIHIDQGWLYFTGNGSMGNPAYTATVAAGATLGIQGGNTTPHMKPITMSDGAILNNWSATGLLGGPITLQGVGNITNYVQPTFRYGGVTRNTDDYYGPLTISGKITGPGSLVKGMYPGGRAGVVYLTSSNNDYQGTTTITAGIVSIGDGGTTGSLGGTGAVMNSGVLQFDINAAYKTSDYLGTRDITGTGGVTYGNPYTVGIRYSANSDVRQVQLLNAVVTIDHDYSYSGDTNINQGKVVLKSANGLGGDGMTYGITYVTAANANTYGGELDLDNPAGMIVDENFVLAGSGGYNGFNYHGPGAIRNVAGNNKITGNIGITSGADCALIVSAGGSLELSGVISNTTTERSLVLGGTAPGIISGQITDGPSGRTQLEKMGSGTWTISGIAYNTGTTTIYDGTLALSGSASINSAAIIMTKSSATLDVTGRLDGKLPLGEMISSQVLVGTGTVKGNVLVNYGMKISTGGPTQINYYTSPTISETTIYNAVGGPISIQGNLDLDIGGNSMQFLLGTSPSSGSNGKITVSGTLNTATAYPTNVLIVPNTSLTAGRYTLISANAAVTNAGGFTLDPSLDASQNTRYGFTLDNATNTKKLDLVVTGSNANLGWRGAGTTSDWDLKSSANWDNGGAADMFYQADAITFNDAGIATTVNLTTAVQPASITVNSSADYVISGSGLITGGTGIAKSGSGILTISNTGGNDYTGTVTITGGTLKVGNGDALGSRYTGSTYADGGTVADGGTLDLNGQNVRWEMVSAKNNGAIVNNGSATSTLLYVELAGDATFGGSRAWNIESWSSSGQTAPYFNQPYLKGNNHTLTKIGTNEIDLIDMGETNLGNVQIQEGSLYFAGTTTMGSVGAVIVSNGAELGLWDCTVTHAKPVVIDASGGKVSTWDGDNTLSGAVFLNGTATISTANDSTCTLSGNISGTAGLAKLNYNAAGGTLILAGNNSYSGPTVITGGTLELTATGQISTASLITNNATFQIDGGTHALGTIDGGGTMNVLGSATVTAASITQDTLSIGGPAGAVAAVPEPGMWSLLLAALVACATWHRWQRR